MKKLLLALTLALAPLAVQAQVVNAPPAPAIQCNQSVTYDTNATGATKLITASASRTTYICGYVINSGGTTNVDIRYGTGTNCATGGTKITPAYALTAQTHIQDNSPFYRGLSAPAGKDVCINSSGTTIAVQMILYYGQY